MTKTKAPLCCICFWAIQSANATELKSLPFSSSKMTKSVGFILDKINQAVKIIAKNQSEIKIACFGLAFKPNIDDLRESPALHISKLLTSMKFNEVLIVEPNINQLPKEFDDSSSSAYSDFKTNFESSLNSSFETESEKINAFSRASIHSVFLFVFL